jgi:hypothetical protein
MSNLAVHVFNTQRQYSAKGQRIAYLILKDRRVAFLDVDRGIDGVTVLSSDDDNVLTYLIPAWLLNEYDHGRYTTGLYLCCEQWKALKIVMQHQAEAV